MINTHKEDTRDPQLSEKAEIKPRRGEGSPETMMSLCVGEDVGKGDLNPLLVGV